MIKLLQQHNVTKKPQNEFWEVASFETQGKRSTMEDRCVIEQAFSGDMSVFVGIFDGHTGSRCAHYLSEELPLHIKAHPQFPEEMAKAMHDAFLTVDQNWLEQAKPLLLEDGSTALCVLLHNDELIVANTGDCRAIMYQGGGTVVLSRDHRAGDISEETRIVQSGGSVIGGRLQGALEVSRSFGDFKFKENDQKYLTAEPEIRKFPMTPEADFIVIGCDGLYEEWQNDDIIQFVKKGFEQKESIQNIVQAMVNEAIDRGSNDNVTGIIVKLKKSYSKILHSGKFRTKKSSSSLSTTAKEKSKCEPSSKATTTKEKGNISDSEEMTGGNSKKNKVEKRKSLGDNLAFIKKRNSTNSQTPNTYTSTTTTTTTSTTVSISTNTTTNSLDPFSKKTKEGISKSEISKKGDIEEKSVSRTRSQTSSKDNSPARRRQYSHKNKIDQTQLVQEEKEIGEWNMFN